MSETIARRYFSKVVGNVGSGCLQIVTQSILIRFLGPMAYGQFIFIRTHFESLVTDLGFSNALFTRISQDNRHYQRISALFILLLSSITLLVVIYVVAVFLMGKSNFLWPEISSGTVWLGLLLALSIFLGRNAVLISDATGHARKIERARLWRAGVSCLCMVVLGFTGRLTIETGMLVLIFGHLIFLIFTVKFAHVRMGGEKPDFRWQSLQECSKDVWPLAKPLVVYSVLTMFPPVFDGWYLQSISGSMQQSHFGLACQIATALFLSTGALTAVFHREIALAFAANDRAKMENLFCTYTKRIYGAAAVPCLFVAINCKEVAYLMGGEHASGAGRAIAWMGIYPIIQGAGQLSVAFQFATNRTALYSRVGMIRDAIGILLVILLVGRLNLGAIGLSIKCVITVSITSYVLHLSNCRYLGRSFPEYLRGELVILATVGGAAYVSHLAAKTVEGVLPSMIANGMVYTGLVLCIFVLFPRIFGFAQFPIRSLQFSTAAKT